MATDIIVAKVQEKIKADCN